MSSFSNPVESQSSVGPLDEQVIKDNLLLDIAELGKIKMKMTAESEEQERITSNLIALEVAQSAADDILKQKKNELSQIKNEIASQNDLLTSLKKGINDSSFELSANGKGIEDRESILNDLDKEIANKQKTHDELERDIFEMTDNHGKLLHLIKDLDSDFSSKEESIALLENELAITQIESNNAKANFDLQKLSQQKELDQLNEEKKQLCSENAELIAEKYSTQLNISSQKTEFESWKKEQEGALTAREATVTKREADCAIREEWNRDKETKLKLIKGELEEFHGRPINHINFSDV